MSGWVGVQIDLLIILVQFMPIMLPYVYESSVCIIFRFDIIFGSSSVTYKDYFEVIYVFYIDISSLCMCVCFIYYYLKSE